MPSEQADLFTPREENSVNLVNSDESMVQVQVQVQVPDQDQDQDSRARAHGPDRVPTAPDVPSPNGTATRLWGALQAARTGCGLEPLRAAPHHLSAIQQLLPPTGGYPVAELDHAIAALGYQARQSERDEWVLNGIDTWRPQVLDRALAMRTKPRPTTGPKPRPRGGMSGDEMRAMAARLAEEGL